MSIRRRGWQVALMGSALVSTTLLAAEEEQDKPTISFGGFIRAEYGAGDRYPEERGEDRAGVSKAALATFAEYEGIKGVLVLGTERLTDGNPDNDGNVDVKDAYIVIGDDKQPGFSFSLGAQPLLFGLKPNGYPGDRSLQPSLEYGGAGAFAVSNQAGPSFIGTYRFDPTFSVRFGAFDLDADNATGLVPADDGSQLSDNLFVQLRGENLFNTGFYGLVGVESIYVGGVVDDAQTLFTGGLGYKQGPFDVSLEFTQLDSEIVGTLDDEQYVIAELTFLPASDWTLYADFGEATESEATTIRVGAHYQWKRYVTLSGEYSKDDFDDAGIEDVDSVDVRLAISF